MNIRQNFKQVAWLQQSDIQTLLRILSLEGEEARIVGGAVRNQLLRQPISDIDIATTCLPQQIITRVEEAGFKAIPTGVAFGTITVVAHSCSYEVTTLRSDIETDGRHAKVVFGRDWKKDAERRDFTINALYCDAAGNLYDDVGGLSDIASRTVRFIGVAENRISEDYLRILRFFRFYAWYGAGRPDVEGLRACVRLKHGLEKLSSERIWAEMKKLLLASDPTRALLWMRQSRILSLIFPETEKWGIDAIHALVKTEQALGWKIDPLLRLESLLPPNPVHLHEMAKRLRLSHKETTRLKEWAELEIISQNCSAHFVQKLIYFHGRQPVLDQLSLSVAASHVDTLEKSAALQKKENYLKLYQLVQEWQIPTFPINGNDLIKKGFSKGILLGQKLKELEMIWIESGFLMDRHALLEQIDL
ncbi:CCA tRNA nucleotidyltransferase [Bartonella krasnovii]|uniref:CCA tRNA nucleotidyltransferase n=1 Tax=Bartonella krasnovii TaxID=2267275 RepID=UPI001F4CD9C6|nr:CCA tRNA nucleotidyltransferase [Bartonella krasnovii]UNF39270.1 CCA tRNA nucleotidyltransferase [Bartonella krasnovii]UNF47454.1 CCA tRNA nucleotidyltransferase [Bartonella krasnovii]UNF50812.1 CCA tRNA nucleotidyltransferase [Bartonella krasnovii]